MAENGNSNGKPRIAWTVDISTVLAILGMVGTGVFFVVQTRSDATTAREQLTDLKLTFQRGIDGVKSDIAGLPAAAAHLIEIDRRLADMDRWREGAERRDNEQRDAISGLTGRLGALERTEAGAHNR